MRGTRRDEELFRFLEGALRVTIRSWIFYSTTPQERERGGGGNEQSGGENDAF